MLIEIEFQKQLINHQSMKQFKFTPSFMAALNAGINDIAQATVRELCAAHVGKQTQARIRKVM